MDLEKVIDIFASKNNYKLDNNLLTVEPRAVDRIVLIRIRIQLKILTWIQIQIQIRGGGGGRGWGKSKWSSKKKHCRLQRSQRPIFEKTDISNVWILILIKKKSLMRVWFSSSESPILDVNYFFLHNSSVDNLWDLPVENSMLVVSISEDQFQCSWSVTFW